MNKKLEMIEHRVDKIPIEKKLVSNLPSISTQNQKCLSCYQDLKRELLI